MSRYQRFSYNLARKFGKLGFAKRLAKSPMKLCLPFWHVVSDEKIGYVEDLYDYQDTQLFTATLDWLLQHFEPVDLDTLIRQKDNATKPIMHLTFDDGLKECADVIAPILYKKGIPATFFINSAFTDNKALFYQHEAGVVEGIMWDHESYAESWEKIKAHFGWNFKITTDDGAGNRLKWFGRFLRKTQEMRPHKWKELKEILEFKEEEWLAKHQPYLTTEQIQKMSKLGFTFGGHSHDHPMFGDISFDEQYEQVKKSMELVRELVEQKVRAFAFPFIDTQVSKALFEKIHQTQLVDITFGTAGLKQDDFEKNLQRIPMEDAPFPAADIIKTEYFLFPIKKMLGKHKVKRS